MLSKKISPLGMALAAIVIFFLAAEAWAAELTSSSGDVWPPSDIPQPQGFCGYCHILTYPTIVNRSYETWKAGKHNKVGCVACHYGPAAMGADEPVLQDPAPASSRHIPPTMPAHFSYLELGDETIPTRLRITDASCMTAACHGRPDDAFKTKKIQFSEKIPFVHEPHLAKKNQIEGMQVNCTTCHQHETQTKHFEVSEASCHLCHFANTKFNQGRARCEICHQLPTKPFQAVEAADKKKVTHQMLKDAGVACSSCHFELIQTPGETKVEPVFENGVLKTVLMLGAGRLKKESCLTCHDQVKYLTNTDDKKLMHRTHVTTKNAVCFDCHRPVSHRKAETNQTMPGDCRACHPESHHYQNLLAAGSEQHGIPAMPDPMFKSRAGCLACHVERKISHKGQAVMSASAKTCVQCHTRDYEKMLALWKRELARKIEKTEELEKKALDALAKYKPGLTPAKLKETQGLIEKGQSNLGIVRFGNGVHNAKYAIALLDAASISFEDTIGLLEGKDISDSAIKYE
jgi:hypothetical protein